MLHAAGGCFPTKTSILKSVAHVSLSCCGSNTKTTELCWRARPVGPLEARGSCPRFSPPPACTHWQERSSVVSLLHEGDVGDLAIKQCPSLTSLPLRKSLLELRSLIFLYRYGRFHGCSRETSGLGRPRSRPQLAAHQQLPPAAGDVVPRRAQDYPQQQDVSYSKPAVRNTSHDTGRYHCTY